MKRRDGKEAEIERIRGLVLPELRKKEEREFEQRFGEPFPGDGLTDEEFREIAEKIF